METSSPVSTEYPGHTLLETLLIDAMESAVRVASSRLRLSSNLHSHATRALFAGTETVPNRELMRIIRGGATKVARGDTRDVRYFRPQRDQNGNVIAERTLKIDRVRQIVIGLLTSCAVNKSDAVRGWAYASIQEAGRVAVAERRDELGGHIDLGSWIMDPLQANRLLNRCDTVLIENLQRNIESSTEALRQGRPLAEETNFMDYSTVMVIDAMHEPVSPWRAIHDLVHNVYVEIDKFEFGLTEDM
jgi:hypothetical protein